MRLCALLLEHPLTAVPASYALMALMSFHAARLPARIDDAGALRPFAQQDRARWDQRLVGEARELLDRAATGDELTEYHVEAAIAAVHALAPRFEDTKWELIITLYDTLLQIRPSPVIALSRAVAIAELAGPERGLQEVHAIEDHERLARYPFYYAALGELELRSGHADAAREHFSAALQLARNPDERRFLEQRVQACAQHGTSSERS
jgi:RNA polymerase sigma-70 factor (ECF subfamily)